MTANIRGILLAAGYSKRFGSNKLLHPLPAGKPDAGVPIALASARHFVEALPESIAVIRPRAQKLGKLLRDAGCNTVVCKNAAEGMGVSLAEGVRAAADAHGWVVALTHDPKLDDAALLEALKSPAFYVGALGSQKNNDARRKRLAGFELAASEIARMRGPVGLKIGSKTPPEIAVAILAELTAVRRGVQIPETIEPPKANVSAGCAVPQN